MCNVRKNVDVIVNMISHSQSDYSSIGMLLTSVVTAIKHQPMAHPRYTQDNLLWSKCVPDLIFFRCVKVRNVLSHLLENNKKNVVGTI